jgi:beta-lactamase class D
MKYNFLTFCIAILLPFASCKTRNKAISNQIISNNNISIKPEFKKYFDSCNVAGSIVVYDVQKKQWILSDTIDTKKETLPASTFKIINLLIALETKVIANENEIVKWVGTDTLKYSYRPEIYHDMTVKEAFEVSAGWVYIELAKRIGKEKYKRYLKLCNYGNLDLSQEDADFWNFGSFAISPINQVEFIKKLYEEELPFSKRNIKIVKRVMLNENNNEYTLSAKTGWTREQGLNIGWWIGYLEKKEGTYFFATRLLKDRKFNTANFGSCRKEITKTILKDLKILN